LIALATAHPAKFPDAVRSSTGVYPSLPPRMEDIFSRPERFSVLPNDVGAVREHVRKVALQ
jgi:threonine synthase